MSRDRDFETPLSAEDLIPLAYSELRRIAASKMAAEKSDHTLQPTALVHEAYLRLIGPGGVPPKWNSRAHFFSAAAEAMRRILIESARRKVAAKRTKSPRDATFCEDSIQTATSSDRLLAVDEALTRLEEDHPDFALIVKLRYYADMTISEIAAALGTSESTVNRTWKSAKVWLYREIGEEPK